MWFLIILAVSQVYCEDVVVDTPKGPIKGRSEGNYSTFFGVPYAKVDVDNPFGSSISFPNFLEPFEATDATIKCPQAFFTVEGTLQCLRLNIYVPQRRDTRRLPVFLWFHGGGFFFGSAGDYDGRYLAQKDIIVVAANYRMGPYGFFCLNDPKVSGNQGLKDQIDAIQWVRDNIHAFGGDSEKITIAGESYGGGSVDLHLFSNYPKLFDKAIVQSGAILDEAFFVKKDYAAATKLAKLLNHTTSNTNDALKFLATVDPLELMVAFNSSDLLLRACKEKKFKNVKSFITEDPFHLHKPKKIRDTPVLFGYNSKETFDQVVTIPDNNYDRYKDIFFEKLNFTFDIKEKDLRNVADIVKKFYLGSKQVEIGSMLEMEKFLSDFILNFAAENSVTRLVEQGAKLYKYLFSYTGNSPYKNETGVGAYHTEELQYLFIFFGQELTEPEHLMMRDRMTTLWANFVKCGNPTPETSPLIPVPWAPVPLESRPYMDIDLEMSMKQDVYHDRTAFWDLLWNAYWRRARILD